MTTNPQAVAAARSGRQSRLAGHPVARLPWVLPASATAVLLLAYLPVFGHAVVVWSSDQEFSFGFLVPPAVLGLLWLRRNSVSSALAEGRGAGLVALVVGLLLMLLSARTGIHALAGLSFLPVALGLAAYLYGTGVARVLLLPLALLALSLSLYRGVLDDLGFALQGLTARGAAALAELLGTGVRRSGVDIFVGDQHLVIAQSCSGMDSLLALLSLGILTTGLSAASLWRRAILLACVIPIVLTANVVRVALVLVLSPHLGAAITTGVGHQVLDGGLFFVATCLLLLTAIILRCPPRFVGTCSPPF